MTVLVFGSINLDLIFKGANQAAARDGARPGTQASLPSAAETDALLTAPG
jgi:sugar/nucleoside kinase (ribokinase family)